MLTMVNIVFLIHFFIHSFTPSSTPLTHLWWAWASQGSHKLRILLLIVSLFIFLLPSVGAFALLSSLAVFLPLRIFDRLLSFPSLKFQHFLKILAPSLLLVLLLLLFSMWFFSSQSPLPHPHQIYTLKSQTWSPVGEQMPKEPQAIYMKLGLDTKDVTGRWIFHLPASTDSNLRSERDLKAHPCLRLWLHQNISH